jgi:hypothetical protein
MKYLKIYENFQIEEGFILRDGSIDIDGICQKYSIENFTIKNGLVDVYDSIDFAGIIGDFIPLKFGHVDGDFYCDKNQLTSLEGAPKSVSTIFGGDFDCSYNKLTSLEGSPESVGGNFNCNYNQLTSLEGSPKSVVHFRCSGNQLKSLEGSPESVGGNFSCRGNQLKSLEGSPKSVGGDFDCSYNQLTSLEGNLKSVGGGFYCYGNPVYEVWNLISPDDKWDSVKMELFSDYDCLRGTNIIIDRFNQFLLQIGKEPVTFVKGYNSI